MTVIRKMKRIIRTEDQEYAYVETATKEKTYADWNPEDFAKPSGKLIKCTGKGRGKRSHYEQFERRGMKYALEDSVLLAPEDESKEKPYVAIIKDIYEKCNKGYVFLEVQWLYRPDNTNKKNGKTWKLKDSRDIFYSFDRDYKIPADSVMHKCIIHFVPPNKQRPNRKQHPGFIVQGIYDITTKKLRKLSDENFTKDEKQEIKLLMANTMSKLGDISDDFDSKEKEICEIEHFVVDALMQLSLRKPDDKFTRFVKNVEQIISEDELGKRTMELMAKRYGRKMTMEDEHVPNKNDFETTFKICEKIFNCNSKSIDSL